MTVRQLNTIACQRNGRRYGARIDQKDWNIHRSKLVELHAAKLRRIDMLEILKKDCNFHPTLPQLNRQMELMGLGKGGKMTVPRLPNRRLRPFDPLNTPVDFIAEYPSILPVQQPTNSQAIESFSMNQHYALNEDVASFENESAPLTELSNSTLSPKMESQSPEADVSLEQPQLPIAESTNGTNIVAGHLLALDSGNEKEAIETFDSMSVSNINPTDPLGIFEYCSQACCEKRLQYHNKMIAAGFLASLQCWSHASNLLHELISDMENDATVSVSDRMWVKINYNRVNGNIFQPDRPTSIWSKGFCDVAEPLHEYIEAAQNEVLSSPLGHLCLTGQFRATGVFQYYLPNHTSLDSYESQVQALNFELLPREEKNRLIYRLMLWCLQALQSPKLRETVEHASRRIRHTLGFRDQILPGLLACHFVSQWIDRPCAVTLQYLARLRTRPATTFKLDVMLPETFAAISSMVVLRVDGSQYMSSSNFVDDLLKCLKNAMKKLCNLSPERYCPEFAAIITELYNQSSNNGQHTANFKDELAMEIANKIMGDSDGPLTWMRSADTFKVHDFSFSDDESEASFDPKLLLTPKKQRTESSSSSKSIEDQASIFSTANGTPDYKSSSSTINSLVPSAPIDSLVPSSTIDSLVQQCENIAVVEKPKEVVRCRLQKRPEISPRRYPTNSTINSGNMSMDEMEMRCIAARTSTMALKQRLGLSDMASRSPSTFSKMSLGSKFSLNGMMDIDRKSSVTSSNRISNRFSYSRDDLFMADALVEQVCESFGLQRHDLSDCELRRKISDWVKHCKVPTNQETSSWRQSYTVEEETSD